MVKAGLDGTLERIKKLLKFRKHEFFINGKLSNPPLAYTMPSRERERELARARMRAHVLMSPAKNFAGRSCKIFNGRPWKFHRPYNILLIIRKNPLSATSISVVDWRKRDMWIGSFYRAHSGRYGSKSINGTPLTA